MSVKSILTGFHHDSVRQCEESMLGLLEPANVLLDCGCADGTLTAAFAEAAGATTALGIEIMELLAADAERRGIRVLRGDLNARFALDDSSVDVVTANQVIEHLHETDGFLSEIHRVLRPGGILVLSTNNLAAWHNIASLFVGAQPFPADVSNNASLGKLFHIYPGEPGRFTSWSHQRIFTWRGLREVLTAHDFRVEVLIGVGYYPLLGRAASFAARVDGRHAAYVTAKAIRI